MKKRTPYDRNDLRFSKTDRIVEIGPGHNPSFRSDVIIGKFDYAICNQVLEPTINTTSLQ